MYISLQYLNLEHLNIDAISILDIYPPINTLFAKNSIVLALSNMTNMKHYGMQICSLTKDILQVQDSAGIQLNSLKIWWATSNSMIKSITSFNSFQIQSKFDI
jgi:hypothetical protein